MREDGRLESLPLCLVPGASLPLRRTRGLRLQAARRARPPPAPPLFPLGQQLPGPQPLALAAEKENSQVSIPRRPVWRGGCSGRRLSAGKPNYCPPTRLKVPNFHGVSLLSTPEFFARGLRTSGEGVGNGHILVPRETPEPPREENVRPRTLLPSPVLKFLNLRNGPNLGWKGREHIHSVNTLGDLLCVRSAD